MRAIDKTTWRISYKKTAISQIAAFKMSVMEIESESARCLII